MLKNNSASIGKRNKKNPNWAGDKVGYSALHGWIKYRILKSDCCEKCLKRSDKLDLANISQKYKRDLDDWEWLCRRCHMIKDGRMKKFIRVKKNSTPHECVICKLKFLPRYNKAKNCSWKCSKIFMSKIMKKKTYKKICQKCHKEYIATLGRQKFCGNFSNKTSCSYKNRKMLIAKYFKNRTIQNSFKCQESKGKYASAVNFRSSRYRVKSV